MNKTKHKKQKYKYHSRKAFNHKKHVKIRKSAKNKQPTNLLFKTVKLYKKQKNKYLDKQNNKSIHVKKQKGGYQPTKEDIDLLKKTDLKPEQIIDLVDIIHIKDTKNAISKLESLDTINDNIKNVVKRYLKENNPTKPEGDNKVEFLKTLAQKLGLDVTNIDDSDIEEKFNDKIQSIRNNEKGLNKKLANAHKQSVALGKQDTEQKSQDTDNDDDNDDNSATTNTTKKDTDEKRPLVKDPLINNKDKSKTTSESDTTKEKNIKKLKDNQDIEKTEIEKKDQQRRRFLSQEQVINRLKRDLKANNVSTKIFNDPTNLNILFTFEINTFDDLTKKNKSTIDTIMNKMKLKLTEKEKLLNLIKEYKKKKINDENKNDKDNDKIQGQKTANVSKLVKELDMYKTKLANIQLKMKEMQSNKGETVCFDTTTPDIVKETGKGKDKKKIEKGTTVRICVETKNNVKQWAKSVAKGNKDKVITGNTLNVSAENV